MLNAFDLVRIHLFHDLDGEEDLEKPITENPSYKEMCRLAQEDELVKTLAVKERYAKAREAFSSEEETDVENWTTSLEIGKSGETAATVNNFTIILENDPSLAGCVGMNLFS